MNGRHGAYERQTQPYNQQPSGGLTPQQAMAQANADPVVQEVIRQLGAELAEAQPLDDEIEPL